MADKRISQLVERVDIANDDVLPIVASGATTTNKVTISTLQDWMQENVDVGVTSVGITIGSTGTDVNVTGSPVTSSGNITINIPTASATNRGLLSSADWSTFNNKVSSVGLSMPSAFAVANSPITGSGTIAVTGAGTVSQYIRGDGSLADFPSGGGGGGASVNYYLNGSVSQGTIGGIAYQEMNKVPVLGAGTDFVAIADGYLASFITDAGDPGLLEIPGGNWNFETYFSASSGGGTPTFYVELYKVNSGGTATLIASNSGTPELIAFGTTITPYFSTLAVPTTALAITDRLALRYYVARSGRTITLHTENSHLCQIITTFTTGLTALNGLTAQVQNFATGTSGTDFAISSSVSTHTFNLPDASTSARGVVTTGTQTFAGYKIFTGTISANNDIQLAAAGTASTTFIKNISGAGLTSIGSNGFGFNNSDNIYFSGSNKGGGIIAFSNTGNQTYTLQDASGTLAFTSDITNSLTGYVTLATTQTITGAKTFDSTTSNFVVFNTSNASGGALSFRRNGANLGHIGNSGVLGVGILDDLEVRSGISRALHLKTDGGKLTLSAGGSVTLDGALNGTSASFTGGFELNTTGTGALGFFGANNTTDKYLRIRNSSGNFEMGTSSSEHYLLGNGGIPLKFYTSGSPRLEISSTGAATFSDSVTVGTHNGLDFLNIERYASSVPYGIIRAGSTDQNVPVGIMIQARDTNGNSFDHTLFSSSGNVGIGTASPASFGARNLDVNAGAGASAYIVARANNNAGTIEMAFDGEGYIGTKTNHGLVIRTNDVQRIYIRPTDGNVGIGNNGESASKLYVTGQSSTSANYALMVRNTNGNELLYLRNDGLIGTGTIGAAPYNNATTGRTMVVESSGVLGYLVSTRESKANIESISNVDFISQLNPVQFNYRKKDSETNEFTDELYENVNYGFIADEVESVNKELVFYNEDGTLAGVEYNNMIAILTKAVQELKTEIDSLKNQIK